MAFESDSIEEFLRKIPRRSKRRLIILGVGAIAVIAFLATTFYSVGTEEVGVIQRFGKYVRTTQPGLHMKIPFGL